MKRQVLKAGVVREETIETRNTAAGWKKSKPIANLLNADTVSNIKMISLFMKLPFWLYL